MKTKPLILVTNDDGITAPGLRSLIEVMNEIGEVVVVAPDSLSRVWDTQLQSILHYIVIKLR